MRKHFSNAVVVIAFLLASLVSSSASAATYVVDQALSSVQFSFVFGGTTLTPQFAGADTAFYGGTVQASVPLGGGLLTLDSTAGFGDSNIVALPNAAGPFTPAIGGAVPAGDDEIFADGTVDPLDNGDGVFTSGDDIYGLTLFNVSFLTIRNFSLTAEGSGNTGGSATNIGWNISGGWSAIEAFGSFSESDLSEDGSDDASLNAAGVIGYSFDGITETITLPVDVNVQDGGNAIILTGQIVAVRTIPEPTGCLLLSVIGGAGILRRRRN